MSIVSSHFSPLVYSHSQILHVQLEDSPLFVTVCSCPRNRTNLSSIRHLTVPAPLLQVYSNSIQATLLCPHYRGRESNERNYFCIESSVARKSLLSYNFSSRMNPIQFQTTRANYFTSLRNVISKKVARS